MSDKADHLRGRAVAAADRDSSGLKESDRAVIDAARAQCAAFAPILAREGWRPDRVLAEMERPEADKIA